MTLKIFHTTTYRFNEHVNLLPHRLMLRPRESRELHLISSQIRTTPAAILTWGHDVFGNAVATATFPATASNLVIAGVAELQLDAVAWPVFDIAFSAMSYPFRYSDDDWIDLGALAVPQFADAEGILRNWAHGFVLEKRTDTPSLLKDLSVGVSEAVQYQIREDEGTQSPIETINRGWGSCRDFAVLFTEAARVLGFGARIVSGYLYNLDRQSLGSRDAGSTHAWAEVFVSGAGWITFDPTNRGVGSFNLIPVAVARNIGQTIPVSGSFVGSMRFYFADRRPPNSPRSSSFNCRAGVSRFCVAWIKNTIKKVTMVVPVLMTSCQVSLKPKIGPVIAHTITTASARRNVAGLLEMRAVAKASRPNHPLATRLVAEVFAVGRFERMQSSIGLPRHSALLSLKIR